MFLLVSNVIVVLNDVVVFALVLNSVLNDVGVEVRVERACPSVVVRW